MFRYSDLQKLAASMTFDEYVSHHPYSVIIARKMMGGQIQHKKSRSAGRTKAMQWSTMLHMGAAQPEETMDPCETSMMKTRTLDPQRVFPVRKQSDEPGAIRIGRGAKCDVVINDYTVSKQHAEFVWDPGTRYHFLVDKGSTNGTSVGTRQLSRDEQCSLKCGYWLVFGRVVCQYLTAEAVYDELRRAG
jgi:hypothetical protein